MAIKLVVKIPRRALTALLMGLAILASAKDTVSSESVRLSTYYPAPSGVYQQLLTTGNAYLAVSNGPVDIGTTNPTYPGPARYQPQPPGWYKLYVQGNEYVKKNLTIGGPGVLILAKRPIIKGYTLYGLPGGIACPQHAFPCPAITYYTWGVYHP